MKKSTYICFFFSILFFYCTKVLSAAPQISMKNTSPGVMDYCKKTLNERLSTLGDGHSIHIAMYTLSSTDIIGYLRSFSTRGGKVCIVVDREQYNSSKDMGDRLRALSQHIGGRVKIRLLGRKGTAPNAWQNVQTMHEKFALLKGTASLDLMIGSYNWTWTASDRNYENCMFLKNGTNGDINDVISSSKTRFDTLWRASESVNLGGSRDFDCLFAPSAEENKTIVAEREAAIVSPEPRGRSREIQLSTGRVAISPITPSRR